MLNWLSSPTKACVASNLPPTVSWVMGTGQAHKHTHLLGDTFPTLPHSGHV
jgi:hypothetical protein